MESKCTQSKPKNKKEYEFRNEQLIDQIKSLEQQLDLKDISMSRLSAGKPLSQLFTEVFENIDKSNNERYTFIKQERTDLQEHFRA